MSTDIVFLIGQLGDDQAESLLKDIGQGYQQLAATAEPLNPAGLLQALEDALPEARTCTAPPGEFARQVLLATSYDPAVEKAVRAAADGKSAEAFGDPLTIALVTAAIVVLNTHGFVRYKDGKWEVDFTVRPLNRETLKALVGGLLRLLGG